MPENILQVLPKINLQFQRADVFLPADTELKIVICRTQKGMIGWNRAYYDNGRWNGSGSMSGVIAWADFNAADVAGLLSF